MSHAQIGNHTTVAIDGTPIGGIVGCVQSGKRTGTADVTTLASSERTFIATPVLQPGQYEVTYNRMSSDSGQAAVKEAFEAKTVHSFEITLPTLEGQTTADVYSFAALVVELNELNIVSPTRPITTKAILRVRGSVQFTAGT